MDPHPRGAGPYIKEVETASYNRGQDRTVVSEKCKLSFQFRGSLACSPGAPGGVNGSASVSRSSVAVGHAASRKGVRLGVRFSRQSATCMS